LGIKWYNYESREVCFPQIVEFLPQRVFARVVEEYNGNKYVKHFTCWNQLLCMLFGQLTN